MDNNKIKHIIERKNEQLEQQAVNRASEIINEISALQQSKDSADKRIDHLRTELKGLEIQKVDAISILGS